MIPAREAVFILSEAFVDGVVTLLRRDPVLGRGSTSSWEEVAPHDYEARERVRHLIEDGVVPVPEPRTPHAALRAFRAFEGSFFGA